MAYLDLKSYRKSRNRTFVGGIKHLKTKQFELLLLTCFEGYITSLSESIDL